MIKKIFLSLLIFNFLLTNFNVAQSIPLVEKRCTIGNKQEECTLADFITAVQKLIRFLLILGYFIAAIVAVVGAFMMMFGGGMKNWLSQGRTMIINAITYYVLLLLAGIFFDLILDFFKPKVYTGF